MNPRRLFYQNTVRELIKEKEASVLVSGGGLLDRDVFADLGFVNVMITNLDSAMNAHDFDPYVWKYENAESLSFPDESFDYVVIHAAIHHSSSPHRVLTEMYRVARLGVLAFEARDSMVMRWLEKTRFTQTYEHSTVFRQQCKYGGVNNTEIPNFIYRWTEREIEKTIRSYAFGFKHKFIFKYATAFPWTPGLEKKGSWKVYLLKAFLPFYQLTIKLFPRQQNLFSFYIDKPTGPDRLLPWLAYDEKREKIRFDRKWGEERYKSPVK